MPEPRVGVYVCHCGSNIAATVDVVDAAKFAGALPNVAVAREYKFMCSEPGQEKIRKDIDKLKLDRVVVAACSPQMHELTFRKACQDAGLNAYLCQVANIREQCSWVHADRAAATAKAKALLAAAVRRVALAEPLEVSRAPLNPDTLVVGGGIAGIQASLELAQAGHQVFLAERDSTIGGAMAKFDKTFPTLDCSACILTPKMVAVGRTKNIRLSTMTEVERVAGTFGNFTVTLRHKARYVTDKCTGCGACAKVCPVTTPSPFEQLLGEQNAIHRTFAQAVPGTYVIEKQVRPPCLGACPIGASAAGVAALVAKKKYKEAVRLLRHGNPLAAVCSMMCHHPCEDECNRQRVEQSVAVRDIERFVLDWARQKKHVVKPPRVERRPERVAVVGSGPAGLACAAELARRGYQVRVFEKEQVIGGALALAVPEFRLPRELVDEDVAWIKSLGVEFVTGRAFGADFGLDTLQAEGFAAAFLATGCNRPAPLAVPGASLPGVMSGLAYLRAVHLAQDPKVGPRVVVVGSDDLAVDAARAARRRGAAVTLVCGLNRVDMPAAREMLESARAEGVAVRCRSDLLEITGTSAVTGVHVMDVVPEHEGAAGLPVPTEAEGAPRLIPCDTVIVAVGEVPEPGLEPLADPETKQTAVPWVFAANLASAGPTAVLQAVAGGRRAAEAIHKYLGDEPLTGFTTRLAGRRRPENPPPRPHSYAPLYEDTPRAPRVEMPHQAAAERVHNFAAVTQGYGEEEVLREAARCLACGVCVECMECDRVCEPGAVRHEMVDELEEIRVGQVLLATGYQLFDARRIPQYGYGRLPDVYTSLEFERMLNSAGPTAGRIVCRDGREPRAIALLHCVGSRHRDHHRYCSRVCCMYALKFAHLVRDRTAAEVYQFYIDIRAYGKGFEEFYERVLGEGTHVIRGRAAEVTAAHGPAAQQGAMVVRTEDTLLGRPVEVPADMVVLCNALEPQADADRVRQLFSISMSPDGFFLERHPKLDPTSTFTDGVFIAGTCQGPKDIPDTVAQASGAAARMLGNIARGEVEIDPVRASITEARCGGCRLCNALCPYGAITYDETRRVSRVTTALCKGCGTCVAACPAGAAVGAGFTDAQIGAELDGLFAA